MTSDQEIRVKCLTFVLDNLHVAQPQGTPRAITTVDIIETASKFEAYIKEGKTNA